MEKKRKTPFNDLIKEHNMTLEEAKECHDYLVFLRVKNMLQKPIIIHNPEVYRLTPNYY